MIHIKQKVKTIIIVFFWLVLGVRPAPALATNSGPFSVDVWVYPTTSAATKALVAKAEELRLVTDASGNPACQIKVTTWQTAATSSVALSLNTWNHVSCTYDKVTIRVYVNGVQTGTQALTSVSDDTANAFKIGQDDSSGTTYANFTGVIDDFKFYNYARSAKQITEDMLGGGSVIASGARQSASGAVGYWKFDEGQGTNANNSGNGSSLNGTITDATWSNSGKFGKALSFTNSSSSYVNILNVSTINTLSTGTFSAWFKTANNGYLVSISNGDAANGYNYLFVGESTGTYADESLCFSFRDTGGTNRLNACYRNGTSFLKDNAWHQAIFTVSDVANKMYVDGKEVALSYSTGSSSTTGYFFNDVNFDTLTIGSRKYNNAYEAGINGLLDEVKIYNYALTSDEIKTDYNHGTALSLGSLSVNSSNVPLNSSSSSYCVPGDSTTCTAPVGEWNFEEGSGASAYDSSGNGNTGTWAGTGTHYAPGKLGKGGKFNGSDDYVDAGNGASLNFGKTDSFSIGAWIKTNSFAAEQNIIAKDRNTGPYEGYQFTVSTNGKLRVDLVDTNQRSKRVPSSIALSAGVYYFVVMSYNGNSDASGIQIYIDGINRTGTTLINDAFTADMKNTLHASIGVRNPEATGDSYFSGSIDQVKIFNYARTAAQVAWDYNRGGPVGHWKFDECQGSVAHDSADLAAGGSGNTGTITIGATGTQTSAGNCSTSATTAWYSGRTGKYNSSLNFDGTDDYVTLASEPSLSNGGTISAWVKTTDTSARVIALDGVLLGISSSTDMFLCADGSGCGVTVGSQFVPSGGNWAHILMTWNNTNLSYYFNGQLVTTVADSGVTDYGRGSYIGSGNGGAGLINYFSGQIDDVRIYNYALTGTQIKNLFNENSAVRFGPQTGSP